MLAQTDALRHESIQIGRADLVIEDPKIAVTHIVRNDQNDVCLLFQVTAFLLTKQPIATITVYLRHPQKRNIKRTTLF